MLEVHLPQMILCFDGRVIEIFNHRTERNRRYHIAHLQAAEVTSSGRNARLHLTFPGGSVLDTFPSEHVPAVEQFVAALREARGMA